MTTKYLLAACALVAAAGCGRAAPGATLAWAQDKPAAPACKSTTWVNDAQGYHQQCDGWQAPPDTRPTHRRGAAPYVSAVPTIALGKAVVENGTNGETGVWMDFEAEGHFTPKWDHVSTYVSLGYLEVSNQADLSGPAAGLGLQVAPWSWIVLDGHGGVVSGNTTELRYGGGLHFRPQHGKDVDWTLDVNLDHVSGPDERQQMAPYALLPNHSTGVLVGVTAGWTDEWR